METSKIEIRTQIKNAGKIIAPLWPLQTIIARNPLQGFETLPFEQAVALGEKYFKSEPTSERSINEEVNRELIKWCQVFLDEGQAMLTMPGREKGFYSAWRELAPFDDRLNRKDKNRWLSSLPINAEEAISFALKNLNVSEDQIEEYLKFSLAELPGWAGYIKWRSEWQSRETPPENPITLTDFLAVRLAITYALTEKTQKIEPSPRRSISGSSSGEFFKALQKKEEEYLKDVLRGITSFQTKEPTKRPAVQLVFCIDVRSEPFRREIEKRGPYETFGFAGFFGLPVSIHDYNTQTVKDCCPVLIKPVYQVFEKPCCEKENRIQHHRRGQTVLNFLQSLYENLKYNFATPYALVETLGIWYGFWMALRTLMPAMSVKMRKRLQEWISPTLSTTPEIDIPIENQIQIAESALRMIGLTKTFSPLVVFCGHGSKTENNPYASALDCGACGGNHGGANGKILASILNQQVVRTALKEKGIEIPQETLFIGGEHNTTTDEMILDVDETSSSNHTPLIENLKQNLSLARMENNLSRCRSFGIETSPEKSKNHLLMRSSNWAEVRPEWGLARNAGFIVAPRRLTKELDLQGRCFLHSYEWQEDNDGKILESILTAPMVVAEWINTQYFFSTLDQNTYGSGSKITHNVTGKFGIMQGNCSDLKQGLPLQSVNRTDDCRYHELLRLQVLVNASREKLEAIIEKHQVLQNLFYHQWVILVALDPENRKFYRLIGKEMWIEILSPAGIQKSETNKFLFKKAEPVIPNVSQKLNFESRLV